MTVTAAELGLYALGMAGLFIVPGPVWVALIARALSGGLAAAWPLAVGVVLGDLVWPLSAILGLSWIESVWGDFLAVLRWVAAGVFVVMGAMLLRKRAGAIAADSRLTRPGRWAGFSVGVAAVIGNPKAMLFYMGALPGFFDLSRLTVPDIAAILAVSASIPLAGNLALAWFVDRARRVVSSPAAMARMNTVSGLLLIAVGLVIPLV